MFLFVILCLIRFPLHLLLTMRRMSIHKHFPADPVKQAVDKFPLLPEFLKVSYSLSLNGYFHILNKISFPEVSNQPLLHNGFEAKYLACVSVIMYVCVFDDS